MPFFQKSVLSKYLKEQNEISVHSAFEKFKAYFHNPQIQQNILNSKEEQFQEGFLRELFVNVFGYTMNPNPDFNLTTEFKNEKGARKADGAVLLDGKAVAVIELKSTKTKDLETIRQQAFDYKSNQSSCVYVITSNFQKIRFYINHAVEFEEFDLFSLSEEQFNHLYLCLNSANLLSDLPLKIKNDSILEEEQITKKFYDDYSSFKKDLFDNIALRNNNLEGVTKLHLYKKTQKLLDRFLFIFFAEDRNLLPPNSISRMIKRWSLLSEEDAYKPLYDIYKQYFGYINTGRKGKTAEGDIHAYNGGLFLPDGILDRINIDDEVLLKHTTILTNYDFESQVDVNILGHIFEHSLNEIESTTAELEGVDFDKQKSKRKKDGVYYTPKYITKYIVDNTVGKLCEEKKTELGIVDEEFVPNQQKDTKRKLMSNLESYRSWILELTICDPACGSGAFLNQALEFLINEHHYIDQLNAQLFGSAMVFQDVENQILEKNIYGVDINEESVDIARLSLWLRTAHRGRKLTTLNNNIKCGNSLIDDPEVAGDKAFKWEEEFPEIFDIKNGKGGFDVVIGNPPYGAYLNESQVSFFRANFSTVIGHSEVYYLFTEKSLSNLINGNGYIGFIIPNAWLSNKYAKALRELIIKNTQIEILINFNRKIIFEEANVETSIVIFNSNTPTINQITQVGQDLENLYPYQQSEWSSNDNYLLSFAPNRQVNEIVKKLNGSEYKLSDKLDISNGVKPYQVGYGINLNGEPLLADDVSNKIYHSTVKIDDSYKKEIKGKGVKRYSLEWEPNYIKWGKWLMSPKSYHYFEQPKILIRQIISDYFFAVIDNEKYIADQSLYICTNYIGEQHENLDYYLALLNSRLYGFYFRKFYSEEDDLFPKIKVNELKSLPIKDIDNHTQLEISELSIQISRSIKELMSFVGNFVKLIINKYQIVGQTKKLQNWHELEFSEFLNELNKAKVKLSLSEEAEWMQYFNEQKEKAQSIKTEIDRTDKEIDQMVYELYGLTEEEIRIVEES